MMPYQFREFQISDHMLAGIRRYIDERIPPGHFLTAIIKNDLREAVQRADDENMRNLPAFVAYFYNEAPAPCWGSCERFKAWLKAELVSPLGLFATNRPQEDTAP